MNSPSAVVSQECSLTPVWALLEWDLGHPFPFFSGLAICRLFLIFFLLLSHRCCAAFFTIRNMSLEEPAVLLMGSAVPCSRSPGDGCAWNGTDSLGLSLQKPPPTASAWAPAVSTGSSAEHIWDAWGMISTCLVPPLPKVSGVCQALTYWCSLSCRDKI